MSPSFPFLCFAVLTAVASVAAAGEAPPLSAAVLNFADGEPALAGTGASVTALLQAKLSTDSSAVLVERAETVAHLKKFEKLAVTSLASSQRFKRYEQALALLLPPDFLQVADCAAIIHLPRYLKALRIRVERAHVAPDRDLEKARLVAPYEAQVQELNAGLAKLKIPSQHVAAGIQIAQFSQLVAEFKVSVFAPELKTAMPVSAKRLELKWQEVRQFL